MLFGHRVLEVSGASRDRGRPVMPPVISADTDAISQPLAWKLETRLGKWTHVITLASMHLAVIGTDIGVKTFAAK